MGIRLAERGRGSKPERRKGREFFDAHRFAGVQTIKEIIEPFNLGID